jgi:hypothetical protein
MLVSRVLVAALIACFILCGGLCASSQAQGSDTLQAKSVWKGVILQDDQAFATTIYVETRNGERLTGEIDFVAQDVVKKLTFEGSVADHDIVAWITDKKEGEVTFPGLYIGKISGDQLSGTWQVPSAKQFGRFSVQRAP